jgi:hypothetical protein
MNHGNYGYREKNFHQMLKDTFTTLSMTRKQQRSGDCETYRITRISMYQLDVKPKNLQYTTTNLGHETQAWYDRQREIHEVMGVQVNSEMPKMWTPLLNSGARNYVYNPISDRTIENVAGNTRKRSCQKAYTPRTDAIPAIKANEM